MRARPRLHLDLDRHSISGCMIKVRFLAFDSSKLARLIDYRDVLRQIFSIFRSAPPATDSMHKILDGTRPFDQNILFPCRMLQRKAEWQSSRINTDR